MTPAEVHIMWELLLVVAALLGAYLFPLELGEIWKKTSDEKTQ